MNKIINFIKNNRIYQSELVKKIRRLKVYQRIKFILLSNMRLPDFLIIGCMKCGTSSLFDYLRENPKIYGDHPKELYFFDIEYNKGLRWYSSHFRRNKLNLEAATHYINSSIAARRIYKLLPNIKLILMLRNPADRTISHYYHNVRKGEWREPLPLIKALDAEVERTKNTDYWSQVIYGYKENSKYLKKIKLWLKYFSLDQFLIIKSEEFFEQPEKVLKKVYEFLNIKPYFLKKYKIFNKGEYIENSEIREELLKYFEHYNKELYKFLGKDFEWD